MIFIRRLPKSNDIEVLKAQMRPLKEVRLRSLELDPQNFYSKYENEIKQPDNFWIDRMRPEYVQHFVAVSAETGADADTIDEQTKFTSFLVVVREYNVSEDQADVGQKAELPKYFLGVVWVDPLMRGQGIGSKIIKESIDWIKQDARANSLLRVRYRLAAMEGNDRAVALYTRLGFSIDQAKRTDEAETDTETAMSMIIDID